MIDISKINKAAVLAALYNASRPFGMGFFHYDAAPMTETEAAELLKDYDYFDYLKGRLMKVSLKGDQLDPRLYDRDLGEGAALAALRDAGLIVSPAVTAREEYLKRSSEAYKTHTTVKSNS